MAAEGFGLRVDPPPGWRVRIVRRPEPASAGRGGASQERTRPVLHACTRDLPTEVADFGGGVVEVLGADDVFVALLDYGPDVADRGLFASRGLPRLAPSQFSPARMPRSLPGRSASQHFFSQGGRAFCLYTVLGSHARRMALVPKAAAVVRSIAITSATTMRAQGQRP